MAKSVKKSFQVVRAKVGPCRTTFSEVKCKVQETHINQGFLTRSDGGPKNKYVSSVYGWSQ